AARRLPPQLHVVVPGKEGRAVGGGHVHPEPQDARNLGAAVDEIAQEDRLSPLGMTRRRAAVAVRRDLVAELLEELHELVEAAMDVADDVEGPVLVLPVIPERLALDGNGVDLLGRREHEDVPKALALEAAEGAAELLGLLAHDVRAEGAGGGRRASRGAERRRGGGGGSARRAGGAPPTRS